MTTSEGVTYFDTAHPRAPTHLARGLLMKTCPSLFDLCICAVLSEKFSPPPYEECALGYLKIRDEDDSES
ncbi:Protein of unknown function [Gryllus bimaculatus]|nr:Protein of unknown function [Gryllus bimaculatus]